MGDVGVRFLSRRRRRLNNQSLKARGNRRRCAGNGSCTKHEHEHADLIDQNGESADEEGKCEGCKKRGYPRCVRWEGNSTVCGNCTRMKEKCSWNGESGRKREVIKRQKRDERAAQLARQTEAEAPPPSGTHDVAKQPSPGQGTQSAGRQDGRQRARGTTPSPSSSRSRTIEETPDSPLTRKKRRME
ncbi:hypothetical protein LX36DRAFT_664396 [Colletotrichum falcatum]|nr:hypothetical protein LX36DRAFT_664396 [Colletotrichum falcatum]